MTVQQDREQLFLELINRARLDPAAEGARYGITDLSAGTGETITTAAKQVLAFNAALYASATSHNQDMISRNYFDHQRVGGLAFDQRIAAAGYSPTSFGSGENIAWQGTTGTLDANAYVLAEHRALFISPGHRSNILEGLFEELGVSALTTTGYQGGYNALVTTHNYGLRYSAGVFVTGVHYTDSDNNDFYSIGESGAGRTAQLWKNGAVIGTSTTANAGGYQIQTAANGGAVEMVYSGGGLSSEQGASFMLAALNVKMDLTDNNTIETNVSATLTRNAQNLTLLSIDNVSGTGNGLANIIKGNKGNNTLDGAGGNDNLQGGDGTDTLIGGSGNDALNGGNGTADLAVFAGNMASYVITLAGGVYSVYGADGSVDTVTAVENFQFSDGTRTLAQLQIAGAAPTRAATLSATATTQTEGNSGAVVYSFTITLNAASHATQTVNYAVAGSGAFAANAADFSGALSGTVTFLSGETSKTIQVTVNGDTAPEDNETFTVTLSGATSGLSLATSSVTATINNDDVAGPNIINGTTLANTLIGTVGIDHINGIDGNDTLRGLGGADVLDGGIGIDTVDYSASTSLVTINLLNNTNSGGDAAGDSLLAIENITGSRYNDHITGSDLANTISGGLGLDNIYGGLGNDVIAGNGGADRIDGGSGTADVASYRTSAAGVTVNLTSGTGLGGDAQGDTLFFIERVYGSNHVDVLIGSTAANVLNGYDGNDNLNGAAGADNMQGGNGDDTLEGGTGNDVLYGNAGADNFRFTAAGLGTDTIMDYDNAVDVISFAAALGVTFNQLVFTNQGTTAVTVSGYDGSSSMIVKSATALTLDVSDFVLV